MPFSFVKPFSTSLKAFTLLIAGLIGGSAFTSAANAQLSNSKIAATYQINYNGLSMGKLHFNSKISGGRYEMISSTKVSVPLLGSLFKSMRWNGQTKTTGTIQGNRPHPQKYHFGFRSNKKRGLINMKFSGNRISHVERVPNKRLSRSYVPVKREHLRGVLDPMSALMTISRKGNSHRSVCQKSMPIYDGTQRFNLKLSYKRSFRVRRSQSGGYAGPVIVCRVRYQPIAGYKPHKKDIKFMINNRNIEIWLMPLPNSRNYAPYRFIIPLSVGTADAYLTNFQYRNARGRKIALIR